MNLKLINVTTKAHTEFIRNLRNSQREFFIDQRYISESMQQVYMKKNWSNYKICMFDNVMVGFIGEVNKDIRLCVVPGYRNKGIGEFMLKEFIWNDMELEAQVKVSNKASLKLFKKCGFMKYGIKLDKNNNKLFLLCQKSILNKVEGSLTNWKNSHYGE